MSIIFDPTVRQHQVQQKYLKAWCNTNQQLWVYRKEGQNLFITNKINAFVVKGYYKLNSINEQEKKYLLTWLEDTKISYFVANNQIRTVEDILDGVQNIFTEWGEVQNQKKDLTLHLIDVLLFCSTSFGVLQALDIPEEKRQQKYNRILKNLAIQSIESYYCAVEASGMPAITKILNGENITEDDAWGLVNYICVQYFRTVVVGELIENSKLPGADMKNIRSILQLILGFKFSNNMNNRENHIQLLDNASSVRFITGCQPVINNLAVPGEMPELLQLYFPISPFQALLITPDEDKTYSIQMIDDGSEVDTLNRKIIHYSDALASKEKEDIERYWPIN